MYYDPSKGHGLPHNPFNAIVSPRPIGWVSTRSKDGIDNLAPYSFFNAVAYTPPQVMFSATSAKADQDGTKDTVANIRETGVFCVNIVSEKQLSEMNKSSQALSKEIDEFEFSDIEKKEKSIEMLKKFHISNLKDKYPHEISGGEAQRVALARTLVTKPSVLLLDEPFNGLDQELKDEIYPVIKNILKTNKMTTIMVSHDLKEVKRLSAKVYNLNNAALNKYES